MTAKITTMFMFILALLVLSLGCGGDHHDMMSNNGAVTNAVLSVYPAEGAVGVSTSASVAIRFKKKMDTLSVMNSFHLIGGGEMRMWMDSATHHGGMGHMSTRNMDHMMNWMDSIAVPGSFSWNEALDSCEYMPTSGMPANQEYMIFMDEGGMMDHNGAMMGSGSEHSADQYLSYHFMTGH